MPAMRLLIVGASGHARVAVDVARRQGSWTVVGLLDGTREPGPAFGGLRVLGGDPDLAGVARDTEADALFIAVGDNFARQRAAQAAARLVPRLPFATLIHPGAWIGEQARIGEGVLICAGAVIGPMATVGAHAIVNTLASLDHDATLNEFASLAPHAAVGGGAEIGVCTAIGIGAAVVHRARIGSHTVVGAGAAVIGDLPDAVVALGVPAKVWRARAAGESYL
jgi:sugar O-acyltransferase (sialic acid O-acetyltransferase NeuD family)